MNTRKLYDRIEAAQDKVSAAVDELEAIVSDVETYIKPRSAKWKESAKGEAWEDFHLELFNATDLIGRQLDTIPFGPDLP